ncbi:hypothetical protein K378_00121 [Streptomyces sp. Amel2xB2]|uniref:hypothetical protein n=1 Tax=Streptomyces sp. Amel2xB2 TaxID=1305829 RepID=UPI000DBABEF9|nr:hypothetical protein [Streptomyces sp. Amel2xB2]RAJ71303.1 hypothetical protein K378_00121 [Streptomyces sp. Amel2xB2]
MDASEPNRPTGPEQPGPERGPAWRRRATTGGWLCAIVVAIVVGAWSFQNASPDAQYARHDPLDESAVRHELHGGRPGNGPGSSGSTVPSGGSSAPPDDSSAPPSPSSPGSSSPSGDVRTFGLKIAHGAATATVQCRADGRIRLLGLSPADGYSADDVEYGPAPRVTFELEPPDDDEDDDSDDTADDSADDSADDDSADPPDLIVTARCSHGKPATSVAEDD